VSAPHPAARCAEIICVRLARDALDHLGPAGTERAEQTPMERGIKRRIDRSRGGSAVQCREGQESGSNGANAGHVAAPRKATVPATLGDRKSTRLNSSH